MFVGSFYHSLESKGRFSLPKVFRASASNWVLTAGLDGCIFIFRQEEFEQEAAKLTSLSYYRVDHRKLIRHFASHASVQETDSLGRLSVSEDLRRLAGIEKKIVIVGAMNHLEVWAEDRYHEFFDNLAQTVAESSEKIDQ